MTNKYFVHKSADVHSMNIGEDTKIWQSVVILKNAHIGRNVNICAHCLIENDVIIGNDTTIKSGVYIWDGVRLGNNVFVGPNVTFCNDIFPRSKKYPQEFLKTIVEDNASIGAGAVILPGITIGKGSMIGAGAVVIKSVPPFAIAAGNPARIVGYDENTLAPITNKDSSTQSINPLSKNIVPTGIGNSSLIQVKYIDDMRGDLSVGEFLREIPFSPKRFFAIFNVPSEETRGEHAHFTCHQFLICLKGRCAVVIDDGVDRKEFALDTPKIGLYVPPLIWGIQYKYSSDAVLLVFASEHYDPDDYIRNYELFLNIINSPNN